MSVRLYKTNHAGTDMNRIRKKLNLSLDEELIRFAKQWSYVTQKPISRLIDGFLTNLREHVSQSSPEIWFDRETCLAGKENQHAEKVLEQKIYREECMKRWKEVFLIHK